VKATQVVLPEDNTAASEDLPLPVSTNANNIPASQNAEITSPSAEDEHILQNEKVLNEMRSRANQRSQHDSPVQDKSQASPGDLAGALDLNNNAK